MPKNTISGRVFLKGTDRGIPGVIVAVHDRDPGTVAEEPEGLTGNGHLGDRLGAVITNASGDFTLAFEDEEFRVRNPEERRPDLQLSILAPEEPGATPESRILFTSNESRPDAGCTEQYLIRLPRDVLEKAGITIPAQ